MKSDKLTPAEVLRYSRQTKLSSFGFAGQENIKSSSALIIGAGGIGCPALQYLAAAGIGTLGIIDNDRVDISNLHRQILFGDADIGQRKVYVAKEKLSKINPHVMVNAIPERFDLTNALNLVSQYDLILDCSDNFETRYLVNDACVIAKKPFIFGAIFGFEGQVAVFNLENQDGQLGPTYRCLFPKPPSVDAIPNCAELGVVGVVPGVIGTLMAAEAIKILAKIGTPLSGTMLSLNIETGAQSIAKLTRTKEAGQVKKLIPVNAGCSITKEGQMAPEMTVQDLKKLLDSGDKVQIVDVRESIEHRICHLDGELIPLSELEAKHHKINRMGPVVVMCHHGMRSKSAINFLSQNFQFTNLVNLKGGIDAWAREIDLTMSRY